MHQTIAAEDQIGGRETITNEIHHAELANCLDSVFLPIERNWAPAHRFDEGIATC